VLVPLLFVGCLVALLVLLQSAGWSRERLDRRRAYWCLVGMLLAAAVWSRDAWPGTLAAPVLGAVALLGVMWGFWNDSRGRS
jgi:uncharacterized membrane protein YdjX (TVP38/TMEM64 family)